MEMEETHEVLSREGLFVPHESAAQDATPHSCDQARSEEEGIPRPSLRCQEEEGLVLLRIRSTQANSACFSFLSH